MNAWGVNVTQSNFTIPGGLHHGQLKIAPGKDS
jgi:hypothetical protein